MELTCAYCGKAFTAKRRRKCCCVNCSGKLGNKTRAGTAWPHDAELWLEQQTGTVPFPEIVRNYQTAARLNGWPKRSEMGIQTKIVRMGLSRRCTEDSFSTVELAKLLNVPQSRVVRWVTHGLKATKPGRHKLAIKAADVQKFLLKHPTRAHGISQDCLAWLFDNEVVAHAIATQSTRHSRGLSRPVVCLTNGRQYPSLAAAAADVYVVDDAIAKAIRTGGTSAGLRWAYADQQVREA